MQEPPAAALARAQRWLRTITNRELQMWRATNILTPTIEERREAGSEGPLNGIPGYEKERELGGPAKLVAVRGRGNRSIASMPRV